MYVTIDETLESFLVISKSNVAQDLAIQHGVVRQEILQMIRNDL